MFMFLKEIFMLMVQMKLSSSMKINYQCVSCSKNCFHIINCIITRHRKMKLELTEGFILPASIHTLRYWYYANCWGRGNIKVYPTVCHPRYRTNLPGKMCLLLT